MVLRVRHTKGDHTLIAIGSVIYYRKEHAVLFEKTKVFGESTKSWYCLHESASTWKLENLSVYATKIPKNLKGLVIGNEGDAALAQWSLSHRYRIGSVVEGQDPQKLLEIARLVGYADLPDAVKEKA